MFQLGKGKGKGGKGKGKKGGKGKENDAKHGVKFEGECRYLYEEGAQKRRIAGKCWLVRQEGQVDRWLST